MFQFVPCLAFKLDNPDKLSMLWLSMLSIGYALTSPILNFGLLSFLSSYISVDTHICSNRILVLQPVPEVVTPARRDQERCSVQSVTGCPTSIPIHPPARVSHMRSRQNGPSAGNE